MTEDSGGPGGERWGHERDLRDFAESRLASAGDLEKGWEVLSRRLGAPGRRRAMRPVVVYAAAAAAIVLTAVGAVTVRTLATKYASGPPAARPVARVAEPRTPRWTILGRAAPVAPAVRVKADTGNPVVLTLGTRARATLGPGAEVFVPEDGTALSVLTGAVAFEVAPDPAAPPFVVLAGKAGIAVKGTTFTVGVDSGAVRVEVSEGVVEVSWEGATVTLRAGENWISPPAGRGSGETGPAAPAGRMATESSPPAPGHDTRQASRNRPAPSRPSGQSADFESERLAGILDAWHRHKDPAKCLKLTEAYLAEFPSGILSQEARYMRLLSLHAMGRAREFGEGLDEFRRLLPGSPYIRNLESFPAIDTVKRPGEKGGRGIE